MDSSDNGLIVQGVFLADDFRVEHNGKEMYIGAYSDEIGSHVYPTNYSFLLIALVHNKEGGKFDIQFEARVGDEVLTKFQFKLNAQRKGYGQLPIGHNIGLKEPAAVDYFVSINGSKPELVRTINFVKSGSAYP